MIDGSTTIKEYIKYVSPRKACAIAVEALKLFPQEMTLKELGGEINEDDSVWNSMWTYWSVLDHGHLMTDDFKKQCLRRFKRPIEAFHAYNELPWLTDETDEILRSIFEGKIPNAEKRLANGEIVRAKDG